MTLWANTVTVMGAASAVVTLISFVLPMPGKRAWLARFVYMFALIALACFVTYQASEIGRRDEISTKAQQLSDAKRMEFTHRGYVHAALAFLEKNNDVFPDTYARAIQMCESYKCDAPGSDVDMVSLASALDGIVKGLSTSSR